MRQTQGTIPCADLEARALLILWILTDPTASEAKGLSGFQEWAWASSEDLNDDSRQDEFGMRYYETPRRDVRFRGSDLWNEFVRRCEDLLETARSLSAPSIDEPRGTRVTVAGAEHLQIRRGHQRCELRGRALTETFRLVRVLGRGREPGQLIPWADLRQAILGRREWRGHLLEEATICRYCRRIRDILTRAGMGDLWEYSSASGVQFRR